MDTQSPYQPIIPQDHYIIALLKNKKIIAILLLIFIPFVLLLISTIKNSTNTSEPPIKPTIAAIPTITRYPTQSLPKRALRVSVLQKTIPGNSIDEKSLTGQPDFLKKEVIAGNKTQYSFESELIVRPNIVQTDGAQVIFERELTPVSSSAKGFKHLTEFLQEKGQPEKIIQGSKYYGWMEKTYIYASKGYAVIGNENANEVLEYHLFIPTTVDEYIKIYGEDLDPNSGPPHDEPIYAE